MTKFFALVVCLSTFLFSSTVFANDALLGNVLKTKQIVRLKLWYDGIEASQKNEQNQEVKKAKVNEELDRVLQKVDL